jgi:hypothetical protein
MQIMINKMNNNSLIPTPAYIQWSIMLSNMHTLLHKRQLIDTKLVSANRLGNKGRSKHDFINKSNRRWRMGLSSLFLFVLLHVLFLMLLRFLTALRNEISNRFLIR